MQFDYSKYTIGQLNQILDDLDRYEKDIQKEWIQVAQAKAKKVGHKTQVQLKTLLSQ